MSRTRLPSSERSRTAGLFPLAKASFAARRNVLIIFFATGGIFHSQS